MKKDDELLRLIRRKAHEFSRANDERVSDDVVEQAIDLLVNKVDLTRVQAKSREEIIKELDEAASCLRTYTVVLMVDTAEAKADSVKTH